MTCKIKDIPFGAQIFPQMYYLISRRSQLSLAFAFLVSTSLLFGQEASRPPAAQNPPAQNPENRNQGPIDGRVPPAQKNPPATGDRGAPDANPKPAAPAGPGAPVDSNTYKIGPADVLLIRVWNEPEFSGQVAVHQDGMFTLPLVGDLQAGDLTPAEVEKNVAKALTKYVVKPLVTITVQEVGSKRYYMDGLVNRPGEYSLVVPTTILEAISKAGGLQEFANSKKLYVLRGNQRIFFNYKDVLRGKHMEQNIQLKPGDHVVAQ